MLPSLTATRFGSFVLAVTLGTVSSYAAPVTLPYTEDFQNPAPSADATADYPEFTYILNGGTATVTSGGVLQLTPAAGAADQFAIVTPTTNPAGNDVIISADISATDSGGNYNVGLIVGDGDNQSRVVFHPGYGGAALRVEGVGQFGNTDVGFTPSNNTLHNLTLVSHPNGVFDITLTNGDNPSQSFTTSFTNAAAYGGSVGFVRSGPSQNPGAGLYDNLSISVVPEPASLGLVGLGGLLLARRRRTA